MTNLFFDQLGIWKIFSQVTQLSGKLMHDFFEYHRVHVLSKHIEQEPVPDIGLLDDGIDDFSTNESEPDVEKVGTHFRADDDDKPVKNNQGTQHSEQNKPETRGMREIMSSVPSQIPINIKYQL